MIKNINIQTGGNSRLIHLYTKVQQRIASTSMMQLRVEIVSMKVVGLLIAKVSLLLMRVEGRIELVAGDVKWVVLHAKVELGFVRR